jgi:death-on-curing protein
MQNHPFLDGNKRTAMVTAITFLWMNDCPIEVPVDEAEQVALAVACGKATKADAAAFFRKLFNTLPRDDPEER